MPWSESIPQFSTPALVLALALLAYAAVGEPLLGRRAFARLERTRDSDPRALLRFYRLSIGIAWAWTAVVVAAVLLAPGLTAAHLGLRAPVAWGPFAGAVIGFVLALLVVWLLTRDRGRGRRPGPEPAPVPEPAAHVLTVLAPRSRAERRAAGLLAVTAGVCEEVLYRGLFVALGVALGLPVWAAAVLSCVLFALAHVYQGWWGLVGPGLVGALFMVVYLGTGSLFVPIVLHILLDGRSLLLTGRGRRHRATSV
ncbi:CPBP family intramembrane glutamic endopeptidase [Nocardiopsis trehalosi]|uniref:CPBP family intramembrane glutamic endopeptidase n=1 Tax=Nocardiopsis trehalosi TaxID=109329 RepID=UPI00082E77CD|nr:CPBP family intramembrane glutamic endopeptidase [Nocardiopsis trehalosi]